MRPIFLTTLPILMSVFLMKNCSNPLTKSTPSSNNRDASTVSESEKSLLKIEATLDTSVASANVPRMTGLSFVAPPRPFTGAVMNEVKTVNAGWIASIPYAYCRPGEAALHFDAFGEQWWGEKPEGVRVTIDSAHKAGIKVMLKPQVYVPGGWTGGLDFATDAEWEKWERDYEKYIMQFVDLGTKMNVEAICIGTEFTIGAVKRAPFWRGLIVKIRQKYKGKLTYSSNWNEYPLIAFWNELDFVGINAYMPLLDKETPSVSELCEAWKPYFEQIKTFQAKVKMPIVFTEYGYMSVDGCGGKGWEIEPKVRSLKINELVQANAIDALHKTFAKEIWWTGGFLWKWFPDGQGHEGYIERDYTPQGKLSGKILRKWYGAYEKM